MSATLILTTPLAAGSYPIAVETASPPPPAAPSIQTLDAVIWQNGKLGAGWQGDDWSAGVSLVHTPKGIYVEDTSTYGEWIAYATQLNGQPLDSTGQDGEFDVSPYGYLVVALAAMSANQEWGIYFEPKGGEDTPELTPIVSSVGIGLLTVAKIPLKAFGAVAGGQLGTIVRKVAIQDKGPGNIGNSWTIVAVGFTRE